MLNIIIPSTELFNDDTNEFITLKEQTLALEHSLVSLSKWESKWCKPFFSNNDKTREETLDYIRCMTLTQNVKPEIYRCLTNENIEEINNYITSPMTASWFKDKQSRGGIGQTITSELIYYWMISLNIPFECQKWHLNRLLTLVRVCNEENSRGEKKVNKRDIAKQNAAINAARRNKYNTKG